MSSVNNLKPIPCFNICEVVHFYNEFTCEPDTRIDIVCFTYYETDAYQALAELRVENPLGEYIVEEATSYE